MQLRCRFLLLTCMVLVFVNVLVEEFITSDGDATNSPFADVGVDRRPARAPRRVADRQSPRFELYKGNFSLTLGGGNTSQSQAAEMLRGTVQITLLLQNTKAVGLHISAVSASLQDDGRTSADSSTFGGGWTSAMSNRVFFFNLQGIEMSGVQLLLASGNLDLSPLGERFGNCPLDAVLHLRANGGEENKQHQQTGKVVAPASLDQMLLGDAPTSAVAQVQHSVVDDESVVRGTGEGAATTPKAVVGIMRSADCGVTLRVHAINLDMARIGQKIVQYAVWATTLMVVQMHSFVAQMRYTEEAGMAVVARISMAAVGCQAMLDAYDSFLHLSLSAVSQYMLNTLGIIAFFKFALFALLEVRYILTIWRHRHADIFQQGWEAVRHELTRIYSAFYGVLVIGLLLIFVFLQHIHIIVLFSQLYWVPQIVHDIRHGTRSPLCWRFVLGIAVSRSLAILYLWGCPVSIFDGSIYPRLPHAPSAWVCLAVVHIQFSQLLIMLSQQRYGPRWFVPWLCLPHIYNYRRSVPVPQPDAECVICMGALTEGEQHLHVVTPCEHRFHASCLEQWMDVKLECPTCRSALPPMS
mmetsp:Transcript_22809/g.53279  ORF Transcript_22809/g.53279 Transcript_22809/m.53279 type:complete len:581 (-) Transcript_22809:69-1811(-)